MLRLPILLMVLASGIGCQCLRNRHQYVPEACPTETCLAPSPKADCPAPAPAPCPAPAAYCPPAQPQAGYGAAPQPQSYPIAMPGFGAAPGYGAAPTFINGEVRERNSVGVMFTTLKIPIPWLRLKVIPQAPEITFRGTVPSGNGFGAAPQQNFGYAGMPMQGFGAASGGQMVYTGTQYVPMQGMQTVQIPGAVAVAGGGTVAVGGGAVAGGTGFGAAPAGSDGTAEAVEKLRQKLKECEELQKQLKTIAPAK